MTGPEIFIEQEDKTASSVLCPLGLKSPEDCLMKWYKLLWLSSLAAAVDESQIEGEGRHAHKTTHYYTDAKPFTQSQICPSSVLPRSVFILNHNRAGR